MQLGPYKFLDARRYAMPLVRANAIPQIALIALLAGALSPQPSAQHIAPSIDQRSYHLGGIGAFAEMVGAGVKKVALSAVLTPAEVDSLIDDAQRIAADNHARLYRERELIVTDLFPADVAKGREVLVIYAGNTLSEYQQLKRDRANLIARGAYNGKARTEIARRFGRLLSYPDAKINALLKETASAR